MLVIFTLVVPPQTIITPLYLNFRNFAGTGLNLLNTVFPFGILGITAMGLKNGLYIFMIRQFYRNVPKELEEAAMIDGAGFLRTFVSVMLPNATSPFIVISMLSFIWYWNDTFYSNILMRNKMMLANKIANIQELIRLSFSGQARGDGATETVIIFAAALLFIIPPLIIYLIAQRFFMESVERTGIVG